MRNEKAQLNEEMEDINEIKNKTKLSQMKNNLQGIRLSGSNLSYIFFHFILKEVHIFFVFAQTNAKAHR